MSASIFLLVEVCKMRLLTALVIAALVATSAFVPLVSFGTARRSSALFLEDKSDYEKALAHNKARTDVRNFLTQRSIQSFIFLLIETRNPHTVTWMERFGGWTNLESFHGTGALNMTLYPSWDSVLRGMMAEPQEEVIVSAKRRGLDRGGWSKNNPYLEVRKRDPLPRCNCCTVSYCCDAT
jgi:type II secretory pathway component PulJ